MRMLLAAFPFVRYLDLANAITALNVTVASVTVALARCGHLGAAATTMCLAAAIDFIDGHVARTYLADRDENRAFGKQLDSLADLLNFSVAPALVLAHVVPSTLAAVVAGMLVLSGALRLAVFGAVTPREQPTGYTGLPTTYSGFILAVTYQAAAAGHVQHDVLLGVVALISILQVTRLRIPKYRAVPTVACFAVSFATVTLLVHHI